MVVRQKILLGKNKIKIKQNKKIINQSPQEIKM